MKKRILFICSEPVTSKFLKQKLRSVGYAVKTAPGGKEGLITAWKDIPDAILIDPDLPDLSGLEVVRKLRNDRRTTNKPIVALSAHNQPEDILSALEAGFDEYVVKDADALINIIEAITRLQSSRTDASLEEEPTGHLGALVVFISAKGGTGTTSICTNVADMLMYIQPGRRVALVDLVLPIGSVASIVGYVDDMNLLTITQMPAERVTTQYLLDNLPQPESWRYQLLAGSPDPRAASELDVSRVSPLIKTLCQGFDYVFVDLGRSLSRISLPIILKANQIVILLSSDLSTVEITKTVLDYLVSLGVERERIFPLLNRPVSVEGLSRKNVEERLEVQVMATIPHMQENFSLANNLHVPIGDKYPNYTATIALREAVVKLEKRLQEVLNVQAR